MISVVFETPPIYVPHRTFANTKTKIKLPLLEIRVPVGADFRPKKGHKSLYPAFK
jgi:hypothetical protein